MGKKQHLSSLAAPKSWPIKRKGTKWIAKSIPGPHNLETSIPLVVVVRDILKIFDRSKDVKKLIHSKDLLVNQTVPKDIKLPVGLFDIISFPKLKSNYRISYSKGKLKPESIKPSEANSLPVKIKSKTSIHKGKVQLNFSNGWNLIVDKDKYKINDVLIIDLGTHEIKEHLKFGIGKEMYMTAGNHIGGTGTLKSIKKVGLLKKEDIATLESKDSTWETKAEYLFIKG